MSDEQTGAPPPRSLTERAQQIQEWARELGAELAVLPDTMRRLREGAANFEIVGQRLAAATESLEEITTLYESTIADSTRRSAEMTSMLRAQVDRLAEAGSPETLSTIAGDVQRTFEALADLNPMWRRPPRN